jgi:hypothetical protein
VTVLAVVIGLLVHFSLSLGIAFLYFSGLGFVLYKFKGKTQCLLLTSHLALAIFIRAHNNRYFLGKMIKLRPGHLAKWIEFHFMN